MSRFASGVTVVSTVDAHGRAHGMTVNALASVSLEPLLVLFCCEKVASLYAPLMGSGSINTSGVNVPSVLVSLVGAVILLAIVNLFRRGRAR